MKKTTTGIVLKKKKKGKLIKAKIEQGSHHQRKNTLETLNSRKSRMGIPLKK